MYPLLTTLENGDWHKIEINRLIIAYSRLPNLKNALFPRRLRQIEDHPVSEFVEDAG
jgi:hypothetical protein